MLPQVQMSDSIDFQHRGRKAHCYLAPHSTSSKKAGISVATNFRPKLSFY